MAKRNKLREMEKLSASNIPDTVIGELALDQITAYIKIREDKKLLADLGSAVRSDFNDGEFILVSDVLIAAGDRIRWVLRDVALNLEQARYNRQRQRR